jgi:hypothetical protein
MNLILITIYTTLLEENQNLGRWRKVSKTHKIARSTSKLLGKRFGTCVENR